MGCVNDPTVVTGARRIGPERLAGRSGTMAMVAMDQRESLRTMFAEAGQRDVGDHVLIDFKRCVTAELTPYASALLVDHQYGLRGIVDDGLVAPGCAVIAAADHLEQPPGGQVEDTGLDDQVIAPGFNLHRVDALKLLVIWRRDEHRDERVELARRFVALAEERGVASVLEPVVRATPAELAAGSWDREAAIRDAARELSVLGPDLYKVQVPLEGRGENETLLGECQRLDEVIATPWVVLSQGVPVPLFPEAVRAACMAGASGFLAGRALWSDVVGAADQRAALREVSVPRLRRLRQIVDDHARPWCEAAAHKGHL